jgi:hypothetical protein
MAGTGFKFEIGLLIRRPEWYIARIQEPLERHHFETAVWRVVAFSPRGLPIVELVRTESIYFRCVIGCEEMLPKSDLHQLRWEVADDRQLELNFPTASDQRFDLEVV